MKTRINIYRLDICMGEIHYQLFLKNRLSFLSDTEIQKLIEFGKSVKGNIEEIEKFFNSLNYGDFKIVQVGQEGSVKEYLVIRCEVI